MDSLIQFISPILILFRNIAAIACVLFIAFIIYLYLNQNRLIYIPESKF